LFDIDAALRYVLKKEGSDLHVKLDERLAVGVSRHGSHLRGRGFELGGAQGLGAAKTQT
jgi:hypothetical protein